VAVPVVHGEGVRKMMDEINLNGEIINVHKLWHSFCDYMKRWYYILRPRATFGRQEIRETKRKYKYINLSNVVGYKAMGRVDKFASKHTDMISLRCDDSYFCSSRLYLIPHETNDRFMGTTVFYIPQCTGEQNQFFLYPDDLDDLIVELKKIQKREKEKKKSWEN